MARSQRTPECHPDRKHWSKGLCRSCYQVKWNRKRNERVRGRPCGPYGQVALCHPDRKHMAKGMCNQCYQQFKKLRDPEKHREQQRRFRMQRRPRTRAAIRRWHLWQKFRLTPEQYDEMLAAQDGKCALCQRPERQEGKRLAVDHCHASGLVRELLCGPCNVVLGYIESADWFPRALAYIEKHRARGAA